MEKSIGIICSKYSDYTSDLVFDWLICFGAKPEKIIPYNIKSNNFRYSPDLNDFSSSDREIGYYSLWFRRMDKKYELMNFPQNMDYNLFYELSKNIENDDRIFDKLILNKLNGVWKISSPKQINVNKLEVLEFAKLENIQIPDYCITNNKKSLKNFFNEHDGKIIVKDLDFPFSYQLEDEIHMIFVNRVSLEMINELPDFFPVSFFQLEIDKKFEIRSFILFDRIYSMAIFSQDDTKTEVDFRRYNNNKPNRRVPFKLPNHIEKKILKLTKRLNLNSCSVDILYSKNNEYFFLEINPVGQFGMVSIPCNYNLEKEIAKALIDEKMVQK